MRRKLIFLVVILITFILLLFNFRSTQVYNIIGADGSSSQKMNASIYFSAYSFKEFEVTEVHSKRAILSIIENVQVRNILVPPNAYTPEFKGTYRIELIDENNEVTNINLLNSKFIEINRKVYKIIHRPNFTKIFEVIILDQNRETLDEFYYNLIDNK